jgi:hypothetical protein
MMKSLIIPGWGQVQNGQKWKIPVIYGAIGGLVYYNRFLDANYRDYRAAYYNMEYPDGDRRFGETPAYLQSATSKSQLRTLRNAYRNQRDMSYIYIALAYGFNAIDAYIWAHLRMFDVSDNLSVAPSFVPTPMGPQSVVSARIRF